MWYIIMGYFLFSACAGEDLYADRGNDLRPKRQSHQQATAQQVPVENYNYRPYNEAPARIKHLLKAQQAQEALVHLPTSAKIYNRAGPATAHPITASEQPLIQYTPKVQYGEAPLQPVYKGIQQAQQSSKLGLLTQNTYTPQYKQAYTSQVGTVYPTTAPALIPYKSEPQPGTSSDQFPRGLPAHIQKIIESQRAFQG